MFPLYFLWSWNTVTLWTTVRWQQDTFQMVSKYVGGNGNRYQLLYVNKLFQICGCQHLKQRTSDFFIPISVLTILIGYI